MGTTSSFPQNYLPYLITPKQSIQLLLVPDMFEFSRDISETSIFRIGTSNSLAVCHSDISQHSWSVVTIISGLKIWVSFGESQSDSDMADCVNAILGWENLERIPQLIKNTSDPDTIESFIYSKLESFGFIREKHFRLFRLIPGDVLYFHDIRPHLAVNVGSKEQVHISLLSSVYYKSHFAQHLKELLQIKLPDDFGTYKKRLTQLKSKFRPLLKEDVLRDFNWIISHSESPNTNKKAFNQEMKHICPWALELSEKMREEETNSSEELNEERG